MFLGNAAGVGCAVTGREQRGGHVRLLCRTERLNPASKKDHFMTTLLPRLALRAIAVLHVSAVIVLVGLACWLGFCPRCSATSRSWFLAPTFHRARPGGTRL